MNSLSFLREIEDTDKKADYVQLLHRIVAVVTDENADEWRASWPFPPSHHSRPWIPAKTGYLNKLENEDIVRRREVSNSTSIYSLQIGANHLLEELETYQHLLDEENPARDLEF